MCRPVIGINNIKKRRNNQNIKLVDAKCADAHSIHLSIGQYSAAAAAVVVAAFVPTLILMGNSIIFIK